jgi:hypothetical protein
MPTVFAFIILAFSYRAVVDTLVRFFNIINIKQSTVEL